MRGLSELERLPLFSVADISKTELGRELSGPLFVIVEVVDGVLDRSSLEDVGPQSRLGWRSRSTKVNIRLVLFEESGIIEVAEAVLQKCGGKELKAYETRLRPCCDGL